MNQSLQRQLSFELRAPPREISDLNLTATRTKQYHLGLAVSFDRGTIYYERQVAGNTFER